MSDRASHSKAPADHRRKWDTLEFEKSAKAREDVEKAINRDKSRDKKEDPVKRELLKIRDYKVDLDSKLGKSVVIQKNSANNSQQGGYYCNVCDCLVKVSGGLLCSNISFSLVFLGLHQLPRPHQWEETSKKFRNEYEDREVITGSSKGEICNQ